MNTHLSIDFETLGHIPPRVVVLSLGAVLFNRQGIISEKIWYFNLEGQINAGRTITADTLFWWLQQESREAKSVFQKAHKEGKHFTDNMLNFTEFVGSQDPRIWSNGAGFDVPIAEHLIAQSKLTVPWKFYNIRCYRTLKAMFDIEKDVKRTGVKHDALDDARFQAECVRQFLSKHSELDR